MDNMTDLLERAIINVKHKLHPGLKSETISTPEPHTQLFGVLQVFGMPDADTIDKVRFIYDYFIENGGDPKNQVVDVYSNMANISDIPLVDRIWKYCRLKDQANRALRHYQTLEREINAFSSPRRKK